jgi:hypothetical protein
MRLQDYEVFGTALSNGETPSIEAWSKIIRAYIGRSRWKRYGGGDGCFYEVLQKYNVTIFDLNNCWLQPDIYKRYRFCHWWYFIKSNILPERERELDAIQYVLIR